MTNSRKSVLVVIAVVLLLAAGYGGYTWWRAEQDALPEAIAYGNGRIEADQVDIAPKYAGRIDAILVSEGDLVEADQVLARMDTSEVEAASDRAKAEVDLAREVLHEAEALVIQRRHEQRFAEQELLRARTLVDKGHVSRSIFDQRVTARDVAAAVLGAAEAHVATAERQIAAAEAEVRRIQSQLDDSILTAPSAGRVLYRLAEPGEVVGAGEAILTLLDLEQVYMEIFLPAGDAAQVAIGADARIVLDILPDFAIPAVVSFVSPEAQFTPKQVETLSEREKLVFRTRLRIPADLVRSRIEHVKTGLRGVGYVKLSPSLTWPDSLQRRMPSELFE
ncbi:MAG: efflux RND transporter periplasmic adaptor subunit [Kiloniellales bacterium]